MFVAVACHTPHVMYSTDAINWHEIELENNRQWYSICYGNCKFVIVSFEESYIAYTEALTKPEEMTVPEALSYLFNSIKELGSQI